MPKIIGGKKGKQEIWQSSILEPVWTHLSQIITKVNLGISILKVSRVQSWHSRHLFNSSENVMTVIAKFEKTSFFPAGNNTSCQNSRAQILLVSFPAQMYYSVFLIGGLAGS